MAKRAINRARFFNFARKSSERERRDALRQRDARGEKYRASAGYRDFAQQARHEVENDELRSGEVSPVAADQISDFRLGFAGRIRRTRIEKERETARFLYLTLEAIVKADEVYRSAEGQRGRGRVGGGAGETQGRRTRRQTRKGVVDKSHPRVAALLRIKARGLRPAR